MTRHYLYLKIKVNNKDIVNLILLYNILLIFDAD